MRRVMMAILLAMFVVYSVSAVAKISHNASACVLQEEGAPGWDPIACWDCDNTPDMVGPVILGYVLGGLIGLMGIGRRRFANLDARASVLRLS